MDVSTILKIADGFRDSRVLLTAVELDLFSTIHQGWNTPASAGKRLGCDGAALGRLMNALVVLGLLEREGEGFRLGPEVHRFLVRSSPEYLGNLDHAAHLWKSWSTLTDAVRKGTTVREQGSGTGDPARVEAFIAAMHHSGTRRAPEVLDGVDLKGVARVLDVGGASGAYALEFARRIPGAEVAVFDLPHVLPITRRYLDESEQGREIRTIPGDYLLDEFGPGWDLVFLSNIIHINSPEENLDLLTRVAASLAPGGRVVIQDFVPEDDRSGPRFPIMFSLNMLVNTARGDTYTMKELLSWAEAAGLDPAGHRELPIPSTLIVLRKS